MQKFLESLRCCRIRS